MTEYLDILERLGVTPNFFTSEAYWQAAGWEEKRGVLYNWVEDGEGRLMLPPANVCGLLAKSPWADFPGYAGVGYRYPLDVQFVYDPRKVVSLEGHDRQVFRKNVHRFEREHVEIGYRPAAEGEVLGCLSDWLEEGQEVYDLETVLVYVEACGPDRSRVLVADGMVVGANLWDENYRWINFRYSFQRRDVKCLSEYLRYCFYREATNGGKLVNDGGNLGSDTLDRFKRKLGPDIIDQIYTWSEEA